MPDARFLGYQEYKLTDLSPVVLPKVFKDENGVEYVWSGEIRFPKKGEAYIESDPTEHPEKGEFVVFAKWDYVVIACPILKVKE